METEEYTGLKELDVMEYAKNYNNWLIELCKPYLGSEILEIGSGIGTFTEVWASRANKVLANEMAPNCVLELKRRFANSDKVSILDSSFLEYDPEIYGYFDTVVSFNVFEHIDEDVAGFKIVNETLKSGGKFLLYVPAFQSLYGKTDKALGHFRRYHKKELINKLTSVDLEIEKIHYVNFAGYFAWYLTAKRSNSTVSKNNVIIYDKLVIPWLKNVEKFLKPPFGQSIFVVAKKK